MPKAYAKLKAKEIAGNLLNKFAEVLDKKDDDEEKPPPPPPKPSSFSPIASGSSSLMGAAHSLVDSFNTLKIRPSADTPAAAGGFVGGFHPGYSLPGNSVSPPPLHHASSAPPPTMPAPFVPPASPQQSLTMQMALRPELDTAPPRPSSAPITSPVQSQANALATPSKPKPNASKPSASKPSAKPSTPQRPSKPQATSSGSSSTPSTPNGKEPKEGQVQCSGTTKKGERCTRMVKTSPALSSKIDCDSDDEAPLEAFCFQHTKEILQGPSGCYARKNGEWFEFNGTYLTYYQAKPSNSFIDWIPAYLSHETQLSLRIEMERARSLSDVDGYIYTFEIRDDDDSDTVKLKVGRAVNLTKRIDEWSKQCGSKEQVLRGYYPHPEDDHDAQTSLMKGRVRAGEKAPCCHRLERLIHLELADLALTQVYLDPEWPHIEVDPSPTPSSGKRNASKKNCIYECCCTINNGIVPFNYNMIVPSDQL
ncbi:hypothetical protein CC2G_005709 [Coprinopsis cinerea AmutBmut pab1-1]|nr:hypothetical protein CC2G_005709 [Coprinopsis cinerea AmutBmut pab1-1]